MRFLPRQRNVYFSAAAGFQDFSYFLLFNLYFILISNKIQTFVPCNYRQISRFKLQDSNKDHQITNRVRCPPHSDLPSYQWPPSSRIRPLPLEGLVRGGLVGASPVSGRSLRRRSIWIYISWMKLNTIDGNEIELWILFMYLKYFRARSRLTGRPPNILVDVEST